MASVSLLAAATFCACDKDNDKKEDNIATSTIPAGKYTINVENGDDYDIDIVSLGIDSLEICSAPYGKGKFTLDLPETVRNKYLEKFDEEFDTFTELLNVKINNPNIKVGIGLTRLMAWETNYNYNSQVGNIYHGTDEWEGRLVYVNEDVTMTGSGEDEESRYDDYEIFLTYKFSVNLKKGWNIMYIKATNLYSKTGKITDRTVEMTTQAPAGAVWWYEAEKWIKFRSWRH
jgi:hypothetical protein